MCFGEDSADLEANDIKDCFVRNFSSEVIMFFQNNFTLLINECYLP